MSAPGPFKIIEVLASGTFGTVCVVVDRPTGRLLALKVLKQHHSQRKRIIARTKDEAEMLRQIDHPSILTVEGLVEIDNRPVVVMEWVRGMAIESLLFNHPGGFGVGPALALIRSASDALDAAWNATPEGGGPPMHIIHRDIKPSNMIVSLDGVLKMVDFGIARAEFANKQSQTLSMVLGARGYLAPERLDGQDDEPAADIYSLGICLYEFMTGNHVMLSVHREYHDEAMAKHLANLKPEGLAPPVVAMLHELFAGMCSYAPEDRFLHPEVVARIDAIAVAARIDLDLTAFASGPVKKAFASRERQRPIDHQDYAEISFLDKRKHKGKAAPPDVDAKIRAVLANADWMERLEELEDLFLSNPHWSPAPFVELLPHEIKPWWKFWEPDMAEPDTLLTVLELLKRRPTQSVRRRASVLLAHPDQRVSEAARKLSRHR